MLFPRSSLGLSFVFAVTISAVNATTVNALPLDAISTKGELRNRQNRNTNIIPGVSV